ncbi:MAG: class I SAM-dependent RNA methyltransferase [Lachnospiraceae bacterium]|nr:class I SAM-dependent RNA methyltransferase [Lachnospiraceae bacterium]MDD6450533.1 class I SAM-dependent RNA methyltransferase [Lachnospiraceae bacterium]MDD6578596.1 class I SAM-dependent RNA methyltransferase [Lachnospiraceae bacterium]
MKQWTLMAPCHFGLEAVLKREIYDLGYEISEVQDGKVLYTGDPEALVLSNIHLRTAERVLLVVGRFRASTFEELFQGIRNLPWEDYLPRNAKFWVTKASSVKSKLFSPSDIQSVTKKAMVERMKSYYKMDWFPEDGPSYPVRIFLMKDEVTVTLDSSGPSLHKRGYRTETGKAPISETLAAALILLTPWHGDRILVDPFCGSGTFPIEAAMMACHMAPGMRRHFTAEDWTNLIPREMWTEARKDAEAEVDLDIKTDIQGYDIDGDVVKIARQNAKRAGVDQLIHFQERPLSELHHPKKYGFIITNPPYGERLEEKEALPPLYRQIGEVYKRLDDWSMFLITSYEDAEKYIGKKAAKNRKIYNGMIRTYFYQFPGPKPPKRSGQDKAVRK